MMKTTLGQNCGMSRFWTKLWNNRYLAFKILNQT